MRSRYIIGVLAVWTLTSQSINASEVGSPLDMSGLKPTLSQAFTAMPKFRRVANAISTPKPLDSPNFEWTLAGQMTTPSPRGALDASKAQLLPALSWHPSETAAFPNADFITATGYSPIAIKDGKLLITADRMPAGAKPLVPENMNADYISGAINSYPYSQKYGYFEARLKFASGKGLWPAFWLLPSDGSWPPELDVMEMLGHDVHTYYATIHTNDGGNHATLPTTISTPDIANEFHNYGMDWGPETVRFYFDRKLVSEKPTPPDARQPFYLILQLSLGNSNSWPGAPDSTTQFPVSIQAEYIKAWQRPQYEAKD